MGLGYRRKSKEFVCPYCKKDFDKEKSMKLHIADKHKVLQVNPQHSPLLETIQELQEDKGWR
jgi:hypothetical protein